MLDIHTDIEWVMSLQQKDHTHLFLKMINLNQSHQKTSNRKTDPAG